MDKLENAFDTMGLFEAETADKRTEVKPRHRPKKKEAERLHNKVVISLNNELFDLLRADAEKEFIPYSVKARVIIAEYFRDKGLYK